MPFGFEHGDSWFDLVWTLCERLETVVAAAETKTGRSFHVHQVKEKFGALRFYPITAMTPSPLSLKLPGLNLLTPARSVPAPAGDAAPILRISITICGSGEPSPLSGDLSYGFLGLLLAVFFADKISGNQAGLVDGGQPATGVGSASDKVAMIQFLELIMGTEVEHLGHVMREVECCAIEYP